MAGPGHGRYEGHPEVCELEREEARARIRAERLGRAVFLDEQSVAEYAAVLEPIDGGWRVYETDERASVWERTVRDFRDESDALDYLVQMLRHVTRARELMTDDTTDRTGTRASRA